MTDLLEQAAEALDHQLFFDDFAARYDELRDDGQAWAEIEAERRVEDRSLSDRAG